MVPAAPPETDDGRHLGTAVLPAADLPAWFVSPTQAGVITSLDLRDPQDEWLFFQARQQKVTPLTEVINKSIEVSDYLAHPVTLVDDNGEMKELVRVVLIGPTGEMFQAASEGVRMSMALIFQVRGRGPWDPPLRMTPKQTKTRRNHNILQLLLDRPVNLTPVPTPPRRSAKRPQDAPAAPPEAPAPGAP